MNNPWEWSKKFQDLLTAKPINTVGKSRYSSGIIGNTSRNLKSGGGMFSKANAGKTANIAGAWSLGLNFASKLFDKSKPGQKGVSNDPSLGATIQPNLDWMQFFKK